MDGPQGTALTVDDGHANGDFAQYEFVLHLRKTVSTGLFETVHDAVWVHVGVRGIAVQREAGDDLARFFGGQGAEGRAAACGAIGGDAMAHKRGVEGLAFALHAQGIDHAGFIIEAKVDPFGDGFTHLEDNGGGDLHHGVQTQGVVGMVEQAQPGQVAAVIGAAPDVPQCHERMHKTLRGGSVDLCLHRDV
ncbi:hypothetical protein DSM110277_03428 (plasmid) [Sulfitobacter pontiacus]|uniref:Uncharacterized protein n=1 Tax=Sulfitobacter pontiacus TaxID=60137 RepID=A0AAX3AFL2_9RHOB|nr:hypothetical protein DSM110277_03428 [Sulfitobacter pontiacus]